MMGNRVESADMGKHAKLGPRKKHMQLGCLAEAHLVEAILYESWAKALLERHPCIVGIVIMDDSHATI